MGVQTGRSAHPVRSVADHAAEAGGHNGAVVCLLDRFGDVFGEALGEHHGGSRRALAATRTRPAPPGRPMPRLPGRTGAPSRRCRRRSRAWPAPRRPWLMVNEAVRQLEAGRRHPLERLVQSWRHVTHVVLLAAAPVNPCRNRFPPSIPRLTGILPAESVPRQAAWEGLYAPAHIDHSLSPLTCLRLELEPPVTAARRAFSLSLRVTHRGHR